MIKTARDLALPRLDTGRFASLEVLTDEALFRQTGVRVAFTERAGGVSEGPYASLNLGDHVGDDVGRVLENRRRVASALGAAEATLIVPRQVHGDVVLGVADPADAPAVQERSRQGADGIVVACPGVASLLCFADCMPVVAVAPSGSFAVVHAGWRGVMAEVAAKAVGDLVRADEARGLRTLPSHVNVYLGPHIHAECFETSEDVHRQFTERFGARCSAGPRHVDLAAAQRESLARAGVASERIVDAGVCTVCSNDGYFSYRAQGGVCGRHGAFAFRAR